MDVVLASARGPVNMFATSWFSILFGAGEMLVAEDQELECECGQRLEYHVYKVRHMYAVLCSKEWSVLNVVEHGEVLLHRY